MKTSRGFTLMEMIIAMVITGILAAVVAVFIAGPVAGYVDTARRAELTDMADLALKRMALEIRTAVPNSVYWVSTKPDEIEFIPARTGGRYCTDLETGCNALGFGVAGDTFSALGPPPPTCAAPAAITVVQGEQVVVYNTGQSDLDAYSGSNRRSLTGASLNGTALTLSPAEQCADELTLGGTALTYASPSSRFQLVPSTGPVKFRCSGSELRRYTGYGWTHTEAGSGALLVSTDSVPIYCAFTYNAISAANGLVSLTLTLTDRKSVV